MAGVEVGRVAVDPDDDFIAFYTAGARVGDWEESLWRPFRRSDEAS